MTDEEKYGRKFGKELVVQIIKNYKIIGTAYYKTHGCSDLAIKVTINIIKNYNQNLVDTFMSDEEFAVRLLSVSNLNNNPEYGSAAGLSREDHEYMEEKYNKKFPLVHNVYTGIISISAEDIKCDLSLKKAMKIIIDFDNKTIKAENVFDKTRVEEYCKKMEISKIDLSSFEVCNMNLDDFFFCDLEEMLEFANNCKVIFAIKDNKEELFHPYPWCFMEKDKEFIKMY